MELRDLGTSGLKVPPVILGAWAIGGWLWGGSDEKDAILAIQTSVKNGVFAVDTAPIYGFGLSETIVGKAIKGMRDKVVIATKCGLRWDTVEGVNPWPQKNLQGNDVVVMTNSNPEGIIKECEASLQRLGTDYIDLYQIHWPDSSTRWEDSWDAMIKLKEQGKVRAIGVSNYDITMMQKIHKTHPIASNQPPYSILRREIENEIVPFCQRNSIGLIVYSPLERGLLTGKITADWKFKNGDHRAQGELFSQTMRMQVGECFKKFQVLQKKYNATCSQLVINWTIQQPGITAALVGARNAMQAVENSQALSFRLTLDECKFMRSIFDDLAKEIDS